ncbi:hypothetical protein [Kushneria aurantia]|uniref:Uncharacterized protein n=1 Tax=Kushneria aurantia TaxID=504092 RepID=A0ABV6G3K2_9GAMM|nr:hypothetical protein [Kushneria aurantia]
MAITMVCPDGYPQKLWMPAVKALRNEGISRAGCPAASLINMIVRPFQAFTVLSIVQ